jgi:hypothetical protein
LQEALATRMLPRSNYYNFVAPVAPASQYFTRSGRVYQDPVNQTGLVGLYRYIIVGGDAARKADGSYYANTDLNPFSGIPRIISNDSIPDNSPFLVISNGFSCKNSGGGVAVDQLNISAVPSCKAGFTLDEITLVARAKLMQEATVGVPVKDRIDQLRTFKNHTAIQLPSGAFVPGYGWRNAGSTIDFDQAWGYSGTAANLTPVALKRVVFYNFVDNTIYASVPITGANTDVTPTFGTIPANAVIRLYFDGPVDYRSFATTFDRQLADCKTTNPTTCRVRVYSNPSGSNTIYGGNTMIPLFPGSTQVILLPPLTGTLSGSTRQRIVLDTNQVRSFSNARGNINTYSILFDTQ